MAAYYFIHRLLILLFATAAVLCGGKCPEDYSPCSCSFSSYAGLTVNCNRVHSSQVRQVLSRTSAVELNHFGLTLTPDEDGSAIPAGLLSGKKVLSLFFYCPTPSSYQLRIDRNAVSSTASHTDMVFISGCDLGRLDFSFLTGFEALTSLRIHSSKNLHEETFATLPALPHLKLLDLYQCTILHNHQDELGR